MQIYRIWVGLALIVEFYEVAIAFRRTQFYK